ncbi:MAG: hypothetical protein NTW19_07825 [Planctomycetota bacterium]|nr:hypothetical protein [Planctomycetota bacterium]
MAKTTPTTNDSESVALSTRFSAKQREVLEEAATILNVAPAKLIREAALERSVDVINAGGASGATLRLLAERFLQPILNPSVHLRRSHLHGDEPDKIERRRLDDWNSQSDAEKAFEDRYMEEQGYGKAHVTTVKPDGAELNQIKTALKSCRTEFARILLETWDTVEGGDGAYEPKVSVEDVLSGEAE